MAQVNTPPLLLVGLGASAGGVQALSTFFSHVTPDQPVAYVVVAHVSPDDESHLAHVLQTCTSLPVVPVRNDMPIEAGHVYVIAPRGTLAVQDGRLVVTPMSGLADRRAPIDTLFRSMAEHYAGDAVAVVLSGTGASGSSGIKRVKEYGGLVIAQTPSDAEFPDMPEHAIATNVVDVLLPAAEMPSRIAAYAHRARTARHDGEAAAAEIDGVDSWREVLRLLRLRTGQDFSNYKQATIRRRVDRRLGIRGLKTVAEYAQVLLEDPQEAKVLMKELLISVTNFFRDAEGFAVLAERVVPGLFEAKTSMDQVRVWSAACATGEEAYSLAMLLVEHAATLPDPPAIQLFATDLDEEAIALAREGFYTEADVAELSPERLRRFFMREAGGYRVRRELRELVVFAHHDILTDPPFSHLDLIACRNLLIHLHRNVQRVIATFHFALRPGGALFLGGSETPDVSPDLFVPVDKNAHIYESRPVATRLPLPQVDRPTPATAPLPRTTESRPAERISPGELHLRLLERFAPPSVVITDEHTVIHMSEHAGAFLQTPGGEPSRDLMKIVHPDLRGELRQALHAAVQNRQPVSVPHVRMQTGGGAMRVNLTIKPVLRDDTPARGYFLILFEDAGAAPPAAPLTITGPTRGGTQALDEELARVREQLRATIEQCETHAEEAKAFNEELHAMNEELTTVNQELTIKIEELGRTRNDFQNLISATDIGAIFLDKSMRVKLTTPHAQHVFNLLPSDIGRPLSDITSRMNYPALDADVAQVLEALQPIEREVPTQDGRRYLLRLVPYRTLDDRIEGVALTFQDVTTRHADQQRWRENEERARRELEEHVRQRTTELRAEVSSRADAQARTALLLRRAVTTQEDERTRIARELHDQLGQQLTALRLSLDRHNRRCSVPGDLVDAQHAASELDQAIDNLTWDLRPAVLDQLGLAAALPRYVNEWSSRFGITANTEIAGGAAGKLEPDAQLAFYRIAQEALTNVARHAHATRVDLVVDARDHSIVMVIEDDGIGFDGADPRAFDRGVGVMGMRERAALVGGTIEVESSPGRGTAVYLRCPVGAAEQETA